MRISSSALPLGVSLLTVIGFLTGCQSEPANNAETEAKMRAAYKKKGFTLDDVPPQQRAMVEGMMKSGKSGQVPVPPSSAPPAH